MIPDEEAPSAGGEEGGPPADRGVPPAPPSPLPPLSELSAPEQPGVEPIPEEEG